jgi:DNA-binding transcriptional regulator YdaS (Cro superfamily)
MEASEFKSILFDLEITQAGLSVLLGVSETAVSHWASGTTKVPNTVVTYLRLLVSLPYELREIEISKVGNKRTSAYRARERRLQSDPQSMESVYTSNF